MIDLLTVPMEIPDEANIIIGQSHFIKTVEDIYEAVVRQRRKPGSAWPSTRAPERA